MSCNFLEPMFETLVFYHSPSSGNGWCQLGIDTMHYGIEFDFSTAVVMYPEDSMLPGHFLVFSIGQHGTKIIRPIELPFPNYKGGPLFLAKTSFGLAGISAPQAAWSMIRQYFSTSQNIHPTLPTSVGSGLIRGMENHYVADASVIPTNTGESPQATVMAFAKLIVDNFINRTGN